MEDACTHASRAELTIREWSRRDRWSNLLFTRGIRGGSIVCLRTNCGTEDESCYSYVLSYVIICYHMYISFIRSYDLVRCNLLLHPLTNIDLKFEYKDFWHFGKRMTLELLEFWKSQRCCCIGIVAYYKLFTDISYARAIL